MSLRKPPALADWLLNRLRLPDSNPPLAGDLLEEFQSGRSRGWYWRQTFAAIGRGFSHNARGGHLTTTVLGWAAQTGVAYALRRFHVPVPLPEPFRTIAAYSPIAIILSAGLFLRRRKKRNTAPDRLECRRSVSVFFETFFECLALYCWWSLVTPWTKPFYALDFYEYEILWLVLFVMSVRRRPPAEFTRS